MKVNMVFARILLVSVFTFLSACAQINNCAPGNLQCALATFEDDEFGDLHAVVVMQDGDVVF